MSWLKFTLPENIKKRVCIYLLQRYLGQFFEEKLTLDQLQIDLYNGTGKVENVTLDVQSLNELGEKQNWPLKFIDGYLEELSIHVPWKSLLKDSSHIEVKGLHLTLRPKERKENATSMFESMWSSMTSSIQLAKECMKQDETNASAGLPTENPQPFEGIEKFAQIIDSVLNRVKIKFIDTVIQFEHVPIDSMTGVGLKINIDFMEYWDLAGNDPPDLEKQDDEQMKPNQDTNQIYVVSSFTTKNFVLQGITFYTVEFPINLQSNNPISQMQESFIQNTATENEPEVTKGCMTSFSRHEILFGKLIGKNVLMLRLKRTENQSGPKVSIELNSGTLLVFLSPRQVHVLLELCSGLASPDLEDDATSNVGLKAKCVEKPMTILDYQRVEQDLQQQLHPLATYQTTGLQGTHGWSTAPLEESGNDDMFYPMKGTSATGSILYDSTLSNISFGSSMESSLSSSSMASSLMTEPSSKLKRKVANIESDPTAEISHFQIRFASLAAAVLHEDILSYGSVTKDGLVESSVKQMTNTADNFFKQLGLFTVLSGCGGGKDFEKAKALFDKACKLNHLRLLAANLQVEGNETTTQTAFSITGKFTMAKLELTECLLDQQKIIDNVIWLKFQDDNPKNSNSPNLRLKFKHIERNSRMAMKLSTKTDVNITMEPCILEMDITIIDRICALLNPQLNITKKTNDTNQQPWRRRQQIDTTTNFKIKIPNLVVNLRFPVPDFRPPHDMQKTPWWKRNVRPDYLKFNMADVILQNETSTNQTNEKYTVQCKTVNLFYYENEKCLPLSLAKGGSESTDEFNCPRLVIELFPSLKSDDDDNQIEQIENEDSSMIMNQSIYGGVLLSGQTRKQAGPFSSKKVVHESDTPHPKHPQDDTEEMVIPGDKQEMTDFIETTVCTSSVRVKINLPTITLQLVSKHIYEIIYNRINNDLLLWSPSAPKPVKKAPNYDSSTTNTTIRSLDNLTIQDTHETFAMCKSGIQYGSESESDEDVIEGDTTPIAMNSVNSGVFYSIYENNQKYEGGTNRKKLKKAKLLQTNGREKSSDFSLTIQIGRGLLDLRTPVRDLSSNNVIPNQNGEFYFNIEDAVIFTVNGYNGDPDLGYVCVQVHDVRLCHCEMTSTPSQSPPLKEVGTTLPKHLHPTIYKSESGTLDAAHGRGGQREMLSVAVKIQANHETHHVKTVRVAFGINKMTLKHRMCHEPNSWISQMIDFFNVLDYPIVGYNPKDVLTELHLHLWDCAIDYRPIHLPLRSLVTMASFSMSSHLSAQANTSTLRFIAEECNLFLSSIGKGSNTCPTTQPSVPIDLKRDYISVLDFDLLELSLKTNDNKSKINHGGPPNIDLRASNNIVHIRTCSDSGGALMQLITYFAMDGDLMTKNDGGVEEVEVEESLVSNTSSPKHNEQELINVTTSPPPQDISNLSKEQHQHVNQLLGEAMVEIVEEKKDNHLTQATANPTGGAQIFFFPDEKSQTIIDVGNPLPQVTHELGDVTFLSTKHSDTDEEFCFVEDDAYLGIIPKNGTPEIRWLTEDPVRVIDNHFAIPVGKTDFLKPPKHYPNPIVRYTLCEMSLIWHMYGGHDFSRINTDDTKQKKVNFSGDLLEVGYTNVKSGGTKGGEIIFTNFMEKKKNKKKDETNWMIKGGATRDHNVLMELRLNKVKFQHELYPDNTTQASRQVLLISELEIRDRLETSQINKFLYQYTSQARPKQTHANMIAIKAVHIRPDIKLKSQECCLKVSILPLRLNIDQDALLFLINFFNELGCYGNNSNDNNNDKNNEKKRGSTIFDETCGSKHSTPTHRPPIMTISIKDKKDDDEDQESKSKLMDEKLLILLLEDDESTLENKMKKDKTAEKNSYAGSVSVDGNDALPLYFRSILFSPEVPIRLDYHGKRVDMTHGPLPGLLMGLGQLNCSELRLKRLSNRHGILGVEKLLNYITQEWINDIKKNQLPSLLGGVGPMHSLVQLFQGIKDLFWMPIEQYQKDGRIVRGLQRGASSFTTSTAMAALELTSRIIHLIQITAETAYDMMSPGPSVRKRSKIKGHNRKYNQPQDIREGVANACILVREGIGETADNFVRIASHEHEQKGYSGAVGGVLRQIPPTIVKPIIIASEATSNVLGGMRSQLVPDARQEANQKWRNDSDS